MSTKWPVVRLGEVADIHNGGTPRTGVADYWDGGLLWVTPAEMGKLSSPYLGSTARTLSPEGMKASNTKMMPANSVIMSSRAPIGHLVINTEPMSFNQGCKGLIPNDRLDHKYLYYFLLSSKDYLNSLGSGTTFAELSAGKLKEVEIPLPPLDEQKRIVAKLDQALGYVDELSQQNTRQIIDAKVLQDAFNSELFEQIHTSTKSTTLGEVAEKVVVGFVGTCAPFYTPDGVPFLRTQNVTKSGIDVSQFQRISRDFHLANKKSQLLEGDVLLSRVITNDVNVGIVPPELGEANCANVVIVRPGKNLLPKFLSAYITTQKAQRYLLDRKVGSAQVVVNTGVVKDWPIVAPSLEEQSRIVRKLDEFLDLNQSRIRVLQGMSENLSSLRSSILTSAFAGDL